MVVFVGIVVALAAILSASVLEGGHLGALFALPSVILVGLGTVGVTVTSFTLKENLAQPKILMLALRGRPTALAPLADQIVRLAEVARLEGSLALEEQAPRIQNRYLRHGVMLLIDNVDDTQIRSELAAFTEAITDRHHRMSSWWSKAASYAPIMGLVGTTMGLINMLGELDDPSKIGHGLAVAMTATLYGLLLANVVCLPVSDKLNALHDAELLSHRMITDGICGINAALSSRSMQERMDTFLAPPERKSK